MAAKIHDWWSGTGFVYEPRAGKSRRKPKAPGAFWRARSRHFTAAQGGGSER